MSSSGDALAALEFFPWSRHFEVGIEEIDEQHKKLVKIVNRLVWHAVSDVPQARCDHILDELLSYAHYHFNSEEQIWNSVLGSEGIARNHHDSHQMFFAQIQTLRSSGQPKGQIMSDLFDFLARWLAFHILESDRRMAMTVKAVEQGLPLDEARRQVDDQLGGSVGELISALLEVYSKLSSSTAQLMRENLTRE
ncbi:bacteriohemerythrin [Marinobacter orientalis]|uniref:Hemerythrin family protein n=1 Tax=Marinobacter orientalis TaxID=1928859 RepID=A0A7Y0REC6_9GAMM|nr:hemerythrin family protein [Marinobacter orientalis]NMT64651.1 hemerythrin family protein [Marinobacter orientalis]TGX48314.1 bacteriohemerythrin [Marinobacter orientalis]